MSKPEFEVEIAELAGRPTVVASEEADVGAILEAIGES